MILTPYVSSIPPLPCHVVGLDDWRERTQWVLTAARGHARFVFNESWKSKTFFAEVFLPNGEIRGLELDRDTVTKADDRLWDLLSLEHRQYGLRFWGRVPEGKSADGTKLWLYTEPALLTKGTTFEAFEIEAGPRSLKGVRLKIRQADRHSAKLFADIDDDTLKVQHFLPLFDDRGDLSCELVSVKTTSDSQFPVHVFYPPSTVSIFWHFLSNRLHEGAATLGQDLLKQANRIEHRQSGPLMYSAGIAALRYGSRDDAMRFLKCSEGFQGAPILLRGLVRIRAAILADLEQPLSDNEREAMASGLLAGNSRDLPLSGPEINHVHEAAARYLETRNDQLLANAERTYRGWARRIDPGSPALAYGSVDLTGPATPLPERSRDLSAKKALAKKHLERFPLFKIDGGLVAATTGAATEQGRLQRKSETQTQMKPGQPKLGAKGIQRSPGSGARPFFRRRKTCPFSGPNAPRIDYKDTRLLSRYVSEIGRIMPSKITAVCASKQRELATAIKRARFLGLMPYLIR
jgi:small subunit ribosomal protein S18